MKKPANISICTYQANQKYECLSDGFISEENNSIFLEFLENGVETKVGISDAMVTITRIGESNYTIIIENNISHETNISSSSMSIRLFVRGKKMLKRIYAEDENKILDLYLSYSIGTLSGEVDTKIRLKCKY